MLVPKATDLRGLEEALAPQAPLGQIVLCPPLEWPAQPVGNGHREALLRSLGQGRRHIAGEDVAQDALAALGVDPHVSRQSPGEFGHPRSEGGRGGKGGVSTCSHRWAPYDSKKKKK